MPDVYAIHVRGALEPQWSTWFDGVTITHDPDGNTILHGAVVDQAALYGLIGKLRDLGLTLIAVLPCDWANDGMEERCASQG